jgi:Peptidase propeptide and YPEB domain
MLIDGFDQECPMRKYIMPIVAAAVLGIAAPAMAYDSGGLISMQRALDVATDLGLATVSHTQFAGDEWQIQGRDMSGRYMEVDVDVNTGEVLNVNR